MKWLKNINSFELVYIAISIATFTHTTWAAATVFEGHQPEYVQLAGLNPDQILDFVVTNFDYFSWLFSGALIAVAVDCGMFIAAQELAGTHLLCCRSYCFVLHPAYLLTLPYWSIHLWHRR
jgi:hypothetical protein